MHEFWAREKLVQAKFVLVKLCTSSFVKLRASEILSTCYPRNGLYLKVHASEIRTGAIRASKGSPVIDAQVKFQIFIGLHLIVTELGYGLKNRQIES